MTSVPGLFVSARLIGAKVVLRFCGAFSAPKFGDTDFTKTVPAILLSPASCILQLIQAQLLVFGVLRVSHWIRCVGSVIAMASANAGLDHSV